MSNQMYNIIRDYGGFIICCLVLIAYVTLAILNNPAALFLEKYVGIILAAYLSIDRLVRLAQGRANGKYEGD